MDAITTWTAMSAVGTVCLGGATLWLAGTTKSLVRRNTELVEEGKLSREQWTSMALGATMARLDAKAPPIDLLLGRLSPDPLYPGQMLGADASPVPAGSTWTFDRDHNVKLAVRVEFAVINRAERSVRVDISGARLIRTHASYEESGESIETNVSLVLPPSATVERSLESVKTLKEWAADYYRLQAGSLPSLDDVAKVDVHDYDDNGVTDTWAFALMGSPIVPIEGNQAGWKLRPSGDEKIAFLDSGARTRLRTYYLSRSADIKLPRPDAVQRYEDVVEEEMRAKYPGLFAESETSSEKIAS